MELDQILSDQMLDYIDNMLRQLFITRIPGITSPLQVRFQPPDDDWRTYVSTLGQVALNVYLIELKENRQMRSCGRIREVNSGIVSETPLPRYVDVHYFVTAWDPAIAGPAVEPTIVEHELLWTATVALMDADPLIPIEIYAPSPLPIGFPALIENAEIQPRFCRTKASASTPNSGARCRAITIRGVRRSF